MTAAPTIVAISRSARVIGRVGIVLAALLALLELVSTVPALAGGPAPIALTVSTIVLDVATLVGVYPAWKGRAWGIWLIIISRIISFLPSLPVFFAPEAADFVVPTIIALSLTLIAVILTAVGLRRR